MSHGTFAWNELRTNDVEGAKTFYGETIGWTFEEMPLPEGTYWIAKFDDEPVAGIIDIAAVAPEGTPPHWFAYLAVDDVDERVEEIALNQGRVIQAPFDIEGVGPHRHPRGFHRRDAGLDDGDDGRRRRGR